MSGETQRQDDASEGDGRAWTPPPPHETPEPRLDDRYSSNLSQRPTPLAALDDLDAEDRAGFEELAERLKVARKDPLEADLDALRRDVAALGRPRPASRPTWLLFAAAGLALTAWILTPPEDPYYATALTS